MNTRKNTPTSSAANAHEEQTAADTNQLRKFKVELQFTQYNFATVFIEAASLAEAEEKADEIQSDEIEWDSISADFSVFSVQSLTKEAQSND